ncbi:MAG: ATP phosphoribosyltransferase regulatory subunit [Oxalobacter sp.]|nr:ATP phosphoribosyltransferase regulatory subunit [Oxalobacter sp.]
MANWLLPEFIADVLPSEARKMEDIRRRVLDEFRSYGYEFVIPPMLEYLDSLLTGVGRDTELETFKLVDQLSGKTMGIRADMTTQVARIDAHLTNRSRVVRLCYAGSILHTRPSGLQATREPLQAGAELFGCAGVQADAEVQQLALSTLKAVGLKGVCLDLSHVGVLKALVNLDPQAKAHEAQLFDMLETKDMPGLIELTEDFHNDTKKALLALPDLYGDVSVLEKAKSTLPPVDGISTALRELEYLAGQADCERVTIDLADTHGYHYHSGVMFAAYIPGLPNAIARGGRYDGVSEAFGRSRPATGFSLDIRELARMLPAAQKRQAIMAPWSDDPKLAKKVRELRGAGATVIYNLQNSVHRTDEFACDQRLEQDPSSGDWVLKTISK